MFYRMRLDNTLARLTLSFLVTDTLLDKYGAGQLQSTNNQLINAKVFSVSQGQRVVYGFKGRDRLANHVIYEFSVLFQTSAATGYSFLRTAIGTMACVRSNAYVDVAVKQTTFLRLSARLYKQATPHGLNSLNSLSNPPQPILSKQVSTRVENPVSC